MIMSTFHIQHYVKRVVTSSFDILGIVGSRYQMAPFVLVERL